MSSKGGSKSVLPKSPEDNWLMPEDIKKVGSMKKLKTMRRKYFVLRDNNDTNLSNLSYYDSEKKFKNNVNLQPKRVIYLKDCFSINRKIDGKHKYALALYTKDDCFATVLDDEVHLKEWLDALIEAQGLGIDFRTGHNIHYDHVWQVCINRNGLGQTRNMNGVHRLCLTQNTLYIVKFDPQTDSPDVYELPLISIRRCGHTSSTFFIELGRSSSIGPGELWIQAEDSAISQNMHEVILSSMRTSKSHEDFGPSQRPRSASTSDKPISSRRATQGSHPSQTMAMTFGASYCSSGSTTTSGSAPKTTSTLRERCDSMPSRSRTNSESDGSTTHDTRSLWTPVHYHPSDRIHSALHSRTLSYSPPSHNPLSTCSTDSAGSSLSIELSIDYDSSHCLTPLSEHHSGLHNSLIPSEPPISEEDVQIDDYFSMSPTASSTGAQSNFRSQLNLSLRPTNTSPITSPTFGLTKLCGQSIKEDPISPYMPMSPVGSIGTESLSSSRRSSGLEKHLNTETVSSSEYMPMMSSQEFKSIASEEYLSMAPLSQSLSESLAKTECLPNLNTSLKEEFHLEKVKSYFSPLDENDSFDYIPPVRAYSIGSRPQLKPIMRVGSKPRPLLPKSGTQTPEQEEEIRIRAFSMGSHANTREMRIAAKKQALFEAQIGAPTAPIVETVKNSKKASSAPVLSPAQPRKRSATVGSRPVFNRSALKGDRSDTDLMEIDYSKSLQSKQKDKSEDRTHRSTASAHRQRSNSKSSISSGIGSTSTTSPSTASSISELSTDKKREVLANPIHKSEEEWGHSTSSRAPVHSIPEPYNNYMQMSINSPETQLPSTGTVSHKPISGQLSSQIPTVPSKHSSTCALTQSHNKSLPTHESTIRTNSCKSEPIAQKPEVQTKTKTTTQVLDSDKDDGDYVRLDIRSTISSDVPQNTAKPSQQEESGLTGSQTVPKVDYPNPAIQSRRQNEANISKTTPIVWKASTQSTQPIPEPDSSEAEAKNGSSDSGSPSRPSSVSSERELNYASLDLAPASANSASELSGLNDQSRSLSPFSSHSSAKSGSQLVLIATNAVTNSSSIKCLTPVAQMVSTPVTQLASCCGSQELLYSCIDPSNQLSYAEIDFGIANKKIAKS